MSKHGRPESSHAVTGWLVMMLKAKHGWFILGLSMALLGVAGLAEWLMGRSLLGPDGTFGLWEGTIWSSECSQRVADAYSFSHVVHGLMFYWALWMVAKAWPMSFRFLVAVVVEAAWEVLENSPIIIERYRQTAMALGYNGDSVLNSLSDIVMMAVGFGLAALCRTWQSIVLVVLMELGCLYWIRDNLTLNVVNLIHPIPAVERWQAALRPASHR